MTRPARIYVASSWRNPWQLAVVKTLREDGHEVYDFREPEPGVRGFSWSEIDPAWRSWNARKYRAALEHPIAVEGFGRDMAALKACDACLLVLPCGTSAHLELGYAIGAGKRTAVLFPHGVRLPDMQTALLQFGHTLRLDTRCEGCGGFDGCRVGDRLHKIEPELMAKAAGLILADADELRSWSGFISDYWRKFGSLTPLDHEGGAR